MAKKIVLLGPRISSDLVSALSISSSDAGVLISSGNYRVSLTMYAGDLHDATVIERVKPWVDSSLEMRTIKGDWLMLKTLMPNAHEFYVRIPIPVGNAA